MRINIHFELDEACELWAKKANKELSALTENEIDFSTGKIKPHITLVMGEIEEKDFSKVKSIVNSFQSKSLKELVAFGTPYMVGPYIFIATKDSTSFKDDCDEMLERLGKLITPHKHLISTGNPPHITLGYVNDANKVGSIISTLSAPKARLIKLSVSRTGKHGTVICE